MIDDLIYNDTWIHTENINYFISNMRNVSTQRSTYLLIKFKPNVVRPRNSLQSTQITKILDMLNSI